MGWDDLKLRWGTEPYIHLGRGICPRVLCASFLRGRYAVASTRLRHPKAGSGSYSLPEAAMKVRESCLRGCDGYWSTTSFTSRNTPRMRGTTRERSMSCRRMHRRRRWGNRKPHPLSFRNRSHRVSLRRCDAAKVAVSHPDCERDLSSID